MDEIHLYYPHNPLANTPLTSKGVYYVCITQPTDGLKKGDLCQVKKGIIQKPTRNIYQVKDSSWMPHPSVIFDLLMGGTTSSSGELINKVNNVDELINTMLGL